MGVPRSGGTGACPCVAGGPAGRRSQAEPWRRTRSALLTDRLPQDGHCFGAAHTLRAATMMSHLGRCDIIDRSDEGGPPSSFRGQEMAGGGVPDRVGARGWECRVQAVIPEARGWPFGRLDARGGRRYPAAGLAACGRGKPGRRRKCNECRSSGGAGRDRRATATASRQDAQHLASGAYLVG